MISIHQMSVKLEKDFVLITSKSPSDLPGTFSQQPLWINVKNICLFWQSFWLNVQISANSGGAFVSHLRFSTMNNIKLVKNILSLNFKGILNKFSILPLQCGSLGSLLLLKVVSQSCGRIDHGFDMHPAICYQKGHFTINLVLTVVRRAVRTFFTFCKIFQFFLFIKRYK